VRRSARFLALVALIAGCGGGGGSIGGLALRGIDGYNGSILRLTGKGEAVADGGTTFTLRSGNRTLTIKLNSANLRPGDRFVIDPLVTTSVVTYSEVGVAATSVWDATGGEIEATRVSPTFLTLRLTNLRFVARSDGNPAMGRFVLDGPLDSAIVGP